MFESLTDKLGSALRNLRGVGKLSEENMADALKEVRTALRTRSAYRGMNYDASQAYTKYIRRLQLGNSGFTCYASLQMPRG